MDQLVCGFQKLYFPEVRGAWNGVFVQQSVSYHRCGRDAPLGDRTVHSGWCITLPRCALNVAHWVVRSNCVRVTETLCIAPLSWH